MDQPTGFYGIAYTLPSGETVISYRGTDSLYGDSAKHIGSDLANGVPTAAGVPESPEALLAFQFYNTVAQELYGPGIDPHAPGVNITLTGHSLGGGLAGLVGAVYDKPGDLFDNMPFELAAENTRVESSPTLSLEEGKFYDASLAQAVYGSVEPWSLGITSDPGSALQTYYVKGEFLGYSRALQETPQTHLDTGPNVNLPGLDTGDLHSMSSLVILLYAHQTPEVGTAWQTASQYFWPVMYDNAFAQEIGATLDGGLKAAGDYSGILREVIAYSAIDEGTRIFGDTGIQALYHDAGWLGSVLSSSGVSQEIITCATDMSKVFVQYAGELALNHVLTAQSPEATGGVVDIDFSGDGTLDIDFSAWAWALAGGGAMPPMAARADLIEDVLNDSTGDASAIYNVMALLMGDGTANAIDKVEFATRENSGTYTLSTGADATAHNADLFVGSAGSDTVTGSAGNDLILGEAGADTLTGGAGNDILVGGAGIDTANYSHDAAPNGITIHWNADGTLSVTDGFGNTDSLDSIENIIGKTGAGIINTLELDGAGTLNETSPGQYEFNGHALYLENITAIKGDSANQIFNLKTLPQDGIDGGAGEDSLAQGNGIYSQITGRLYNVGGTESTLLSNIEHIENAASTIVMDPHTTQALPGMQGVMTYDYSAATVGYDTYIYAANQNGECCHLRRTA